MQSHRQIIEMAARRDALLRAMDILNSCGADYGSDVVRGMFVGFAMAYRAIDRDDCAALVREFCEFAPPAQGCRPVCVVDNTKADRA